MNGYSAIHDGRIGLRIAFQKIVQSSNRAMIHNVHDP
jgi:hypothetical protein